MSGDYGVSGINGIGMLGLGDSYNQYMMSAMGGYPYYGMGMTGMNGYPNYAMNGYTAQNMLGATGMSSLGGVNALMGMGGMLYNPTFMAQMNKMQQDMELAQLNHASDMTEQMLQNNIRNYKNKDLELFTKALQDDAVNKGITNLRETLEKGNMDGACVAFDQLKNTLFQKYGKEYNANSGQFNPDDSVTQEIERLYAQIVSAQKGEQVNLRDEIRKYGQTPFEHGFIKNWRGDDYHAKCSEEAIAYMFGTPTENASHKERMKRAGKMAESVTEGAIAGLGGLSLYKIGSLMSKNLSGCKFGSMLGIATALAGDIWWQMSR